MICVEEVSQVLHQAVRAALPARPDYAYFRAGTAHLFMITALLEGWRHVEVPPSPSPHPTGLRPDPAGPGGRALSAGAAPTGYSKCTSPGMPAGSTSWPGQLHLNFSQVSALPKVLGGQPVIQFTAH